MIVQFQTLSQIVRERTQFSSIQRHVWALLITVSRLCHHFMDDRCSMDLHVEINQTIGHQIVYGFEAFEILFEKVAPIRFVIHLVMLRATAESQ